MLHEKETMYTQETAIMARRTHRTTGDSRRAMAAAKVDMAEDSITCLACLQLSELTTISFPPAEPSFYRGE